MRLIPFRRASGPYWPSLPAARYYVTLRYVMMRQKMSPNLSPAVLPAGAQEVLDHILTEAFWYRPK
jgi:hypothetical protein